MGILWCQNKAARKVFSLGLKKVDSFTLRVRVARWVSSGLAIAIWMSFGSTLQAQTPSITLSPSTIRMGAFYNGATVRIEGTAPPSCNVLVIIRGSETDEFFNKKGRVGPIWINTDKIHIARAPSVFLSFSNADVSTILDRATLEAYQLDESSIKFHLVCRCHCKCLHDQPKGRNSVALCTGMKPDPEYDKLIRNSYIAFKSSDGSYQTHPKAVRLGESRANGRQYALEFEWLRNAPPGSYQVEVYAYRDQFVLARATTLLQVVEVGFPLQMAGLAKEHPWAYGLIAVLVAVVAGFAIDVIGSRLRRPAPRRGPQQAGQTELARPEMTAEESKLSAEKATEHESVHHS